MEKLKKNWQLILIFLLIVFGMNKCTVSCNRSQKIDSLNTELVKKDSVISARELKIDTLSHNIDILNERISGYDKSMQIKDDAIKQISDAKKNINVTVKSKK